MMDWTNIVMTLITSGAFTAVFLLGDRKTSQVLDNVGKSIAQWREIADEYRKEKEDLRAEISRKETKIGELYKEMSVLRDRNDRQSSRIAHLNAFRCVKVRCTDREPPFGTSKTEKDKKEDNDGDDN